MPFEIPGYHLLNKLGEGAMAEVWLAEHKRNARKAAIKILKPAVVGDADFEKLFLREGQVIASFDHPNIVKIYDNDRVGDVAYLAMEYLAGGDLLQRMRSKPIAVGEALGLIAQIGGALEAAHRQNIIHRDLKPANIMLRDEATPVLTDFGAVRVLDRSTIFGRDGGIVGTPLYMSPEQITAQPLSGSSDLYALGVIFHELLTGQLPFPGLSFPEIATQHLYAPLPKLPEALAMLQPVLDQMLAKSPADRYASAQHFVDDLRRVFLNDEALRRQVGYAGTSMAWSSQLRALGFVLDPQQKDEARLAQGDYLRARAAHHEPSAALPGPPPSLPPPPPSPPPPPPSGPIGAPSERVPAPTIASKQTRLQPAAAPTPDATAAPVAVPAARAPIAGADSATVRRTPSVASTAVGHKRWRWLLAVVALGCVAGLLVWQMALAPGKASLPGGIIPSDSTSTPPATSPAAVTAAPAPDRTAETSDDDVAAPNETVTAGDDAEDDAFVDDGNGMLYDTITTLTWSRNDNGADINWNDASAHCSNMGMRLPSNTELLEIFGITDAAEIGACPESQCGISPQFNLTGARYWSSTSEGVAALFVDFSDGSQTAVDLSNAEDMRALCVTEP